VSDFPVTGIQQTLAFVEQAGKQGYAATLIGHLRFIAKFHAWLKPFTNSKHRKREAIRGGV
jgi:hypothetical protein